MIGDVWEWTSTDFHGYPGYETFPYPEYSEVFFGGDKDEYKVLEKEKADLKVLRDKLKKERDSIRSRDRELDALKKEIESLRKEIRNLKREKERS